MYNLVETMVPHVLLLFNYLYYIELNNTFCKHFVFSESYYTNSRCSVYACQLYQNNKFKLNILPTAILINTSFYAIYIQLCIL